MRDDNVITGRGLLFALFTFSFAAFGFCIAFYAIISDQAAASSIGFLFAGCMLPLGIYGLMPKKISFTKFDVSYWVGKKKKFELLWKDITELKTYTTKGKYSSQMIEVHTKNDNFSIETGVSFPKKKMIAIFKRLVEGTKNNENIKVSDNLNWLNK
jgi:hypothetical protein